MKISRHEEKRMVEVVDTTFTIDLSYDELHVLSIGLEVLQLARVPRELRPLKRKLAQDIEFTLNPPKAYKEEEEEDDE